MRQVHCLVLLPHSASPPSCWPSPIYAAFKCFPHCLSCMDLDPSIYSTSVLNFLSDHLLPSLLCLLDINFQLPLFHPFKKNPTELGTRLLGFEEGHMTWACGCQIQYKAYPVTFKFLMKKQICLCCRHSLGNICDIAFFVRLRLFQKVCPSLPSGTSGIDAPWKWNLCRFY